MDKWTKHTGVAAPLQRSNVDTDAIIPAIHMRGIKRSGLQDNLFEVWRANDPDFVLNQPEYKSSSILVAGPDFATGSSREHAVWALKDYGFKAILSSRFHDIFRNNSGKNGLLTCELKQEDIEAIWTWILERPGSEITVDLVECKVYFGDFEAPFEVVDEQTRHRLLNGLDDIDITLENESELLAFEQKRFDFMPKTLPIIKFNDGFDDCNIASQKYDTRSPIDPNVGIS